ncbi:hypothetical protein DM46_832 [Burkholderia mallei]|nr:hypothetical protein DM46_832 [Burkholderia mallei]KOS78908.1 hypothetical protein DM53_2761 [Burkholderia mallei]
MKRKGTRIKAKGTNWSGHHRATCCAPSYALALSGASLFADRAATVSAPRTPRRPDRPLSAQCRGADVFDAGNRRSCSKTRISGAALLGATSGPDNGRSRSFVSST